jgi:hypothetical protein
MIDSRKGEEKKPVGKCESEFPQSLSKPEKREQLPSQKPAPKQALDD